jgi:hypothetical protein
VKVLTAGRAFPKAHTPQTPPPFSQKTQTSVKASRALGSAVLGLLLVAP